MLAARPLLLIFPLILLAVPTPASAQQVSADTLTDAQVQSAIETLVESLYARKHPQRFWELEKTPPGESTRQGGGYTALVTLALLHAGQSYQDPRLRDAIEYLGSIQMQGTYAVAMRACVWAKLPPRFRDRLAADTKWLLDGFNPAVGGWDYVQNPTTKYHDNSIRQFGALALWEAARHDARIDRRVWQQLEDTFIQLQREDGGWNYKDDHVSTGSMTTAGLATLFITQDLLHADAAVRFTPATPPSRSAPATPAARNAQAIERGLAWMNRHFSATANPGRNTHFHYYLYGVERVALAGGYKHLGGRDWFREGAAALIRDLLKWDAAQSRFVLKAAAEKPNKTDDIAFALLFLSRGRVPVAVNKLEFDGAWNNRPRDVANLTRWIGEQSESELNWQVVKVSGQPEECLDAPLLYIASNEALPWLKSLTVDAAAHARAARSFHEARARGEDADSPAAIETPELVKLRRYLELGGTILAVNEGGAKMFADSVERAGLLMFPQYEWSALPQDHWAYSLHTPVRGRRPPMRALSNGVRELIILVNAGDISSHFQKNDTRQHGEYHTVANIYYHASELNRPRPRLAAHVPPSRAVAKAAAVSATIVRAIHEGNWNPEPQALPQFADWLTHQRDIVVHVVDHPLVRIHEIEPRPELVIVNGIDPADFSAAQISAMKSYVAAGGTLLFETPGGRGEFTASAEQAMVAAFRLPIESALRTRIITGEGLDGATDLTRCEYRPFTQVTFGTRETTPRLRCMTVAEGEHARPQIYFSREDLSHALLDQPRWGINGYSPQTARNLLANLLQEAMAESTEFRVPSAE